MLGHEGPRLKDDGKTLGYDGPHPRTGLFLKMGSVRGEGVAWKGTSDPVSFGTIPFSEIRSQRSRSQRERTQQLGAWERRAPALASSQAGVAGPAGKSRRVGLEHSSGAHKQAQAPPRQIARSSLPVTLGE